MTTKQLKSSLYAERITYLCKEQLLNVLQNNMLAKLPSRMRNHGDLL